MNLPMYTDYLITDADKAKITALDNPKVTKVIDEAIQLMNPKEVIVINDDPKDIARARQLALDMNEEKKLATQGHSIHYDGFISATNHDQARDKSHTAVLLPKGQKLSRGLNVVEREAGLKEVLGIMNGVMRGKTMIVRFFCLGPTNSRFSLSALQITDSSYVSHSEDLLYRQGYEQFKKLANKDDFFYFYHSAGELNERGNTKNIDKRRIYIDPIANRVYSVNNQYAGNSLACKKLALRLAINKANNEDWLAEHMFISAFSPIDGNRKTYFAGAYPSACGKTSTAMIPGGSIVGDDIAYLREGPDGEMRGANVEHGIFGIIRDVNEKDDPEIFKAITEPKEVIFSNILTTDSGETYWEGMGKKIQYPDTGINFSGNWTKGNRDAEGVEIPLSHPNARFTLKINELVNCDEKLHDPAGVEISAILYGGRDSDTTVPVVESLSWAHGVFIGATIESETTAATIGKSGVRKSSPMANMDFVIVPLGKYLSNHIKFGNKLKKLPKVFATNYFLKSDEGEYLNSKLDKKIWVLWAEGRIHGDFGAISTPIGNIPEFDDLHMLFDKVFHKDYTKEEYINQFSIYTKSYLEKFARMEALFKDEENMPPEFWEIMESQKKNTLALQEEKGEIISPFDL
ncbi:phosphoenolpyruvate carboxykinase (GTP) [Candidatus Lokiarchaeum ossiferum]|uniref:phosphoenolpyruvate carboxykinase (GTP) n=1 Tax=Candidatus Lokiarchaeum ossiferum TaxID=2951803 RepID=UPI00352C6EDA